jgi:antitoxin VapB
MEQAKRAKLFWTSRSQAIRLPKEYRFSGDSVLVRKEGKSVIIEPLEEWPDDYVQSFLGAPEDFARPDQGEGEQRSSLPVMT